MALEDLLLGTMQGAYNMASLKEQKAGRKAQEAYNRKLIELQERGLGLQAEQMAKQYALQMAQLEWEKESFRQEFGETQKHNEWERGFQDRELALNEAWRTAEQTGFRDGTPTLENLKFQEGQRQFDLGRVDNERDFYEKQRQFNVESVMNAPRGPADWAAYVKKLRGLQGSSALPGAVDQMFDPSQQASSFSNSGQFNGPVLTNADLALAITGQGGPDLSGTPWAGWGGPSAGNGQRSRDPMMGGGDQQPQPYPGAGAQQPQPYPGAGAQPQPYPGAGTQQPQPGTGERSRIPQGGGSQSAAYTGEMPYVDQSGANGGGSSVGTQYSGPGGPSQGYSSASVSGGVDPSGSFGTLGSSNPYSADGSPSGGSYKVAQMLGSSQGQMPGSGQGQMPGSEQGQQSSPHGGMVLPSAQKFRRYSPNEQAMGLGYLSENGGPTENDAMYLMERQAPQFRRGQQARYSGM
jgi:hypothetical protein